MRGCLVSSQSAAGLDSAQVTWADYNSFVLSGAPGAA